MCRAGGRRCPSHSDPVAIANRNARRRAVYQKSKGHPETTHVGTLTTPGADPSRLPRPFDGKEQSYHRAAKPVQSVEALNIEKVALAGELVRSGYFADTEVHGTIDYTNLDEKSYLEFGFLPVKTGNGEWNNRTFTPLDDVYSGSTTELSALDPKERQSLRYFTGNDYRWMNKALYGEGELKKAPKDYTPLIENDGYVNQSDYTNKYLDRHEKFLEEVTGHMDTALAKGPKKNRILYRGMSRYNHVFGSYGSAEEPNPAHDWVKKNMVLGQEMIFDGYQSASMSAELVSGKFAGDEGGVVFEILTPEGVNVSDTSYFPEEAEVLLPRGGRYMVVGVHHDINFEMSEKVSLVQLVAINDKGEALNSETHHTPKPLKASQKKLEK